MNEMRFTLHLSADDMLRHYRGDISFVLACAEDGRKVRFPAAWLRPFLRREGVHGQFRLRFDENHRLIDLQLCS